MEWYRGGGGGVKKTSLFRGHIPYQGGGVHPPPAKNKSTFFREKVKNIQHALKNLALYVQNKNLVDLFGHILTILAIIFNQM